MQNDAICSGPMSGTKFVYNNGRATTHITPSGHRIQTSSAGHVSVPADVNRITVPNSPRWTRADQVAGTLVGHFEQSPVLIREFLLLSGYFKHLPNRLGESAALRDCVELFTSSWANFRRGLPSDDLIDPKLYAKALRSLRHAINGKADLSCETLAAMTVMERWEIMFDNSRPLNWSAHRGGIIALMVARGPPKPEDEMDTLLALDNYLILVCTSLSWSRNAY